MVPIFVIERSKYGINGVEEHPPDIVALMCLDLCEFKKIIEEDFHVGQ